MKNYENWKKDKNEGLVIFYILSIPFLLLGTIRIIYFGEFTFWRIVYILVGLFFLYLRFLIKTSKEDYEKEKAEEKAEKAAIRKAEKATKEEEESKNRLRDEARIPIEEACTNDLITIITKNAYVGFIQFDFKKDSIKIHKMLPSFGDNEGNDIYLYQQDEFTKKITDEFLVKDGDIRHQGEYEGIMRYFSVGQDGGESGTEYLEINYKRKYSGDDVFVDKSIFEFINTEELPKVEKIIYFFNHITSYKNMVSLNESYFKYTIKIAEEKELFIKELDADGNGVIDISENNDFSNLLKSKQNLILEFEKSEGNNYIQKFIKLSNYLKDKSKNIQSLFEIIRDASNISNDNYNDYVGVLRNQINTYNLMLLSALNMIVTLTEDDRITFYEIYETFDKLNVFTSNHEREISKRLENIENKLDEVVNSIHEMEINICNELLNLQFISEDITSSLDSLSQGLSEIDSSIQANNMLTGIQTYQLYKINKQTKGLVQ